jgi:hypothetical protein
VKAAAATVAGKIAAAMNCGKGETAGGAVVRIPSPRFARERDGAFDKIDSLRRGE